MYPVASRGLQDQYLCEPYIGENLLHIAIVNQNIDMVRWLLDRDTEELLVQRATGQFFSLGHACYYGEYPLSFAAATNNAAIAELLISKVSMPEA